MIKINERGIGKVGLIMVLLFGGAFVFIVWPIIGFFYTHEELRGFFEHQAKTAHTRSADKTRRNLTREIRDSKIDVDIDRDLIVERSPGEVRLALEWEEVLAIDFGEEYEDYYWELYIFEFSIEEEARLPKSIYDR